MDVQPPFFGDEEIPLLDCDALLTAFLAGAERARCEWFHIEGPLLVAARFTAVAIRLEGAVLLRADVPADVEPLCGDIEAALRAQGIVLAEPDNAFAGIVAIEIAGERGGMWDIWAAEPDSGRAAVMRRAAGEFGDLMTLDAGGVLSPGGDQASGPGSPDKVLAEYEAELDEGP